VSPPLEPGAHRHRRLADPALDDVEHVPSVIGEDAAAGDRRIDSPVPATLVTGQSGARAQGVPDHVLDPADPPLADQLRRAPHDRRVVPVVDGVEHATGLFRQTRQRRQILGRADQRLFAEHVTAALEGLPDQRRVAARRRADVDEIHGGLGEELGRRRVPARRGGMGRDERVLLRPRVGDRDDLDVTAAVPAGQVPVEGDVAQADDRAALHPIGARDL